MNKSYLKYAGGKSRILEEVLATFPDNIKVFAEPFVGSCTVALNVEAKEKMLNDYNVDLIETHRIAYHYSTELIDHLEKLYPHGRDIYYTVRDGFNEGKLTTRQKAAAFIYMNKHGFNGMSRYNKKGKFNVPVGKGNSIHFPKEELLNFRTNLNSDVVFLHGDFEHFCNMVPDNSVVYCDPPYVPKSATLSDINYTGEAFTWADQCRLRACILCLQSRGCHVVVSNHDLPITRDLYKDADEIRSVQAFRSISSKDNRGQVAELLAVYLPK